ncbi:MULTISPECIES: Hcp family type VI secretion system effector [unclassified Hahella]|uniref:Hcp family type VI secretion system effector n=1 Tax=unclassified Hahella TaxID=2624107 RepID=UPI001C1EA81C|nr:MULTISPECIES: type VI secretion system tube protein Hcp [unclassified Hahella]MBU6955660.1 type VI secretion system tube protein Hcp [Hahella sp. HN01]MDG9668060.1 type VI secretion system tube protein Hcp [Hahella sp. CR1]
MAIYMNYDGLKVKGNVTAEGYKDWIRLDSFQFGVGRHITMEAGHMSNREATRPSISEISVSKLMDTASSGLFKESLTGTAGVKVLVDIVRTQADKIEKYVSYEMEDVMVSSYSISAGAESAPAESISLSFSKVTMSYTAADKKHAGKTPERVGYDLEAGKKI